MYKLNQKNGILTISAVGASTTALSYNTSVLAQTTPPAGIAAVDSMVDSLAGIAGVITAVVLGAMGVRMAVTLVNRVGVKG